LLPWVKRRLARWDRRVRTDIERFDDLDERERHALRKRIKRLRYATEWVAPLFSGRPAKRYLAALRDAQACLGEVNDVTLALAAFQARAPAEPLALFALGWLTSQRECLLATAPQRLAALARAPRFWKKKHAP
jgi:CHAD domain-containing protein